MASIKGKVLRKQLFTNYTFLASNCNIRLYKKKSANSVHMGPAVELWKEREMDKTRKKYEKLSEKIMFWEDKKKKKAKRKLHRTERAVEKAKLKAKKKFVNDNERIEIIAASARTHAYDSQMKEELKVKEKANLMRTTGKNPCTCL